MKLLYLMILGGLCINQKRYQKVKSLPPYQPDQELYSTIKSAAPSK